MSGRSNHFNHSFYDDKEAGEGVTQLFLKSEAKSCIMGAGLGSVWRKRRKILSRICGWKESSESLVVINYVFGLTPVWLSCQIKLSDFSSTHS